MFLFESNVYRILNLGAILQGFYRYLELLALLLQFGLAGLLGAQFGIEGLDRGLELLAVLYESGFAGL